MKFTIDRTKWLRGEYLSLLLRPGDGMMCCIGQVCEQIGIDRRHLRNCGVVFNLPPGDMDNFRDSMGDEFRADAAYSINDDSHIPDDEREKMLAEHFGKFNHEIEFIN
jgi:hypothetical protein